MTSLVVLCGSQKCTGALMRDRDRRRIGETRIINGDRTELRYGDRRCSQDIRLSPVRNAPDWADKGALFRRFGFRADVPEELVQALLDHVRDNAVTDIEVCLYGAKYRVDGPLTSPGGKPTVRTIWMILNGQTTPRFVTAFPC